MNRWAWLLAVPYVVTVSSESYRIGNESWKVTTYNVMTGNKPSVSFSDEEMALDFAEAMNEAHERRTRVPEWEGHGHLTIHDPKGLMK